MRERRCWQVGLPTLESVERFSSRDLQRSVLVERRWSLRRPRRFSKTCSHATEADASNSDTPRAT